MSKLYIANCMRQDYEFTFRMPGSGQLVRHAIRPGHQTRVSGPNGDTDLSPPQIDEIVGRHRKYGLVAVEDIPRHKPFAGTCYSVDKPVKVNQIELVMEHNQEVLVKRGQAQRMEAAVAVSNLIDNHLRDIQSPAELHEIETEVIEDEGRGDPSSRMQGEGVLVTKDANPKDAPEAGEKPNRRRNRKAA